MRVIQISIERRGLIIPDRNRTNESRSIGNIITPAKDVNCPAILLLAARRQGSASLRASSTLTVLARTRRVSINSRRRFFVLPNQNGTHCGAETEWTLHGRSPFESVSECVRDLRFHPFQFVVAHRVALCAFDEMIEEQLSPVSVALG